MEAKSTWILDAGVDLQLAGIARLAEQPFELFDHVRRRQIVMFGAADIKFPLRFAEIEMRALRRISISAKRRGNFISANVMWKTLSALLSD